MSTSAARSAPPVEETPVATHEQQIGAMLADEAGSGWRIPNFLASRMPFCMFAVAIRPAAGGKEASLQVECILPLSEPSVTEARRFKLQAETPRFVMQITESRWCGAIGYAALMKVTLGVEDALMLLVAERLAKLEMDNAPNARPFITKWIHAIAQLAEIFAQMKWQAIALEFDRHAVRGASTTLRDEAVQIPAGWGKAGREEQL